MSIISPIDVDSLKVSRGRSGLAAVELALLLPLLSFLFVIVVDYARIFYFSLTVTNCARNGAVYGSQNPTNALDTKGIQAEAKGDAGTLTTASLKVTSLPDSKTSPTKLSVTVTYPFATITRFPGINAQTTLSRTVQVNVTPLVPN